MCETCGCSDDAQPTVTNLQTGQVASLVDDAEDTHHLHHHHEHDHHDDGNGQSLEHTHSHNHEHSRDHTPHSHAGAGRTIRIEQDILAKNNQFAQRNRGWFAGRGVLAFNLMSSPGAGKTTLLERMIQDLKDDFPIHVIEGDQATLNDAERIKATGCPVVQINTGTGCHLEADMLARGVGQLDPPMNSLVLVENVGNLVCPALFDLGEAAKVVITAVTDGEDKPIKYPHMFRASDVMIVNKIDLLPHVRFDVERCIQYAREVNAKLKVFQLSATTGDGLDSWYDWVRHQMQHHLPQLVNPLTH